MIRALLKKQLLETTAFFLIGKDGKLRSKGMMLGFAALLLYGFGAMGVMFWWFASSLCEPLVLAERAWVYFAFISVLATAFGIIGGVFMAKTKLYEAKDNELLLSMPIPTWAILLIRVSGLYLFTLLFEALVFIPALIQYFVVAGFSFVSLVTGLFALLIMPLGAVAICCLLGFLLAWITAKLPFKNLLTVLGFLAFMVGYSIVYSKLNEYLGYVAMHGEEVGNVMQTFLYPFGQLGRAVTGDIVALLLFTVIFVGLFALVYGLISATYLRIATAKGGEFRAKYKEKEYRGSSPMLALLKKEATHFVKSPAYLLNTSMGTMMMVIVGAMMLIYGDFFGINPDMVASIPELSRAIGLLVSLVVCFMAASNTVAACSISVEGEQIWIVQALPVDGWSILKAKLYLHFLVTVLPALFCGIAMGLIVELEPIFLIGVGVTALFASAFFAVMDLAINLKFPTLRWTNETVAIKQGLSMLFAMFGSWGVSLLPLGAYFLFGKYLPPLLYLGMWLILFLAATILLVIWLKKRGTKIFARLSA